MNLSIQPRLGAMFFGGYMCILRGRCMLVILRPQSFQMPNFPYKNLITALNSVPPNLGSTPTGPAMWDTLNYFQQTAPQYGGLAVQTGSSDKWKNPMYVCDSTGSNCTLIPCAKTLSCCFLTGNGIPNGHQGGGRRVALSATLTAKDILLIQWLPPILCTKDSRMHWQIIKQT